MRSSLRFKLLLIVLTSLAALLVIDGDSHVRPIPGVVKAVASSTRPREDDAGISRQAAMPSMILALQERGNAGDWHDANAFPQRDWTPPPPPPLPAPPPPPPAPPQAPPLPFSYLGKIVEGKQWTVFLGQQDRIHTVVIGDTIGNDYKVESIAPPMLTLIYLPLKQSQSLPIGLAE